MMGNSVHSQSTPFSQDSLATIVQLSKRSVLEEPFVLCKTFSATLTDMDESNIKPLINRHFEAMPPYYDTTLLADGGWMWP